MSLSEIISNMLLKSVKVYCMIEKKNTIMIALYCDFVFKQPKKVLENVCFCNVFTRMLTSSHGES